MADVKISALPAVVTAATTDIFAIVQGGVTYKASLTQVIAAIPDATGSTRGLLSAADWTTFNGKQSALTFSTGLTNAAGTVTSNLSTGVAGGQSVIGGTAASNNLTLSSTSNATKGKILFGTSAYDEVNNRLGIGTASPSYAMQVVMNDPANPGFEVVNNTAFTNFAGLFEGNAPSLSAGQSSYMAIGRNRANNNQYSMAFFYSSNGSTSNRIDFTFYGQTPSMSINANKNVLIGTTTDAGYRLDVNGTARVQERLTVSQDNTVATQVVSVINTDTANCGMVIAPSGTGAIMAPRGREGC